MYYLSDFCSICLAPNNNITPYANISAKAREVLGCIVPGNVLQETEIPKKICEECSSSLDIIFEFRRRCLKNMCTLNNYIQKLKEGGRRNQILSVTLTDIQQQVDENQENRESIVEQSDIKIEKDFNVEENSNFEMESNIEVSNISYYNSLKKSQNEEICENTGVIKREKIDEEMIVENSFQDDMQNNSPKIKLEFSLNELPIIKEEPDEYIPVRTTTATATNKNEIRKKCGPKWYKDRLAAREKQAETSQNGLILSEQIFEQRARENLSQVASELQLSISQAPNPTMQHSVLDVCTERTSRTSNLEQQDTEFTDSEMKDVTMRELLSTSDTSDVDMQKNPLDHI